MLCPRCGKPNDEGASYCSACGAPLPEAESERAAPSERPPLRQRLGHLAGRTRRERLVTAVTAVAIIVAAVAAIVVLSDGGDEDLEQADTVCVESKRALAEVGRQVPESPGEGSAALRLRAGAAAEIVAEWRSRLAGLDLPSSREQAAAQLEQALAELELRAREAAVARSGEGSVGLGSRLIAAGESAEEAIEGLGLEECAETPPDLPGTSE